MLFYAGFFAVGLPFLCWGATGASGHEHAHAHFIFAETDATPQPGEMLIRRRHIHRAGEATIPHVHHQQPHHWHSGLQENADVQLDLRSTAEFSARSSLLVLLLGLWTVCTVFVRHFPTMYPIYLPQLLFPAVPLPPPRLLSSII